VGETGTKIRRKKCIQNFCGKSEETKPIGRPQSAKEDSVLIKIPRRNTL